MTVFKGQGIDCFGNQLPTINDDGLINGSEYLTRIFIKYSPNPRFERLYGLVANRGWDEIQETETKEYQNDILKEAKAADNIWRRIYND